MSEPVLLSYHDSILHESDGELLQGPHWINDKLIQFQLEYMEHTSFPSQQMTFVGPDVTQFARLCGESDLGAFLAPLELQRRRLVLLVINDCEQPDSPGGTHWSLLAFLRSDKSAKFYHYDSSSGSNRQIARLLARRLAPHLGARGAGAPEEALCGRQVNGYDCGMFVICHAEAVARRFQQGEDIGRVMVTQEMVDRKRVEMLELIRSLAASKT